MIRISLSATALIIALAACTARAITPTDLDYYAQATTSYITSGDFYGSGGSVRLGLFHKESHCFEAELSCFHMAANTTPRRVQVSHVGPTKIRPVGGAFTAQRALRIHADTNEFPVFLNYRFKLSCERTGVGVYAGAGLGLNFMQVSYTSNVIQNEVAFCSIKGNCGPIPVSAEPSKDEHGWRVSPAGQVFAGVSYALTKQLSFLVGGKLLFSKKYAIVNPSEGFGMMLQTQSIQKAIEAGFSYQF